MDAGVVVEIARALEALSDDLRSLERAGAGIPAVEKNVVRMRGALRALEGQFSDLAALQKGSGG